MAVVGAGAGGVHAVRVHRALACLVRQPVEDHSKVRLSYTPRARHNRSDAALHLPQGHLASVSPDSADLPLAPPNFRSEWKFGAVSRGQRTFFARGAEVRKFRAATAVLTPDLAAIVLLTLKVGIVATAVMLPIAFALAWVLARSRVPGRLLIDGLVHLPLVVPPVVTGWMLLELFAPAGPLGALGGGVLFRWTGAAIAAGVMGLPLSVRAIRLSLEAVDRRLEEAARTLGAGRWRVFRTVTLPLAMPGVLAGAVLGFARGIGEFGATITFVSSVPGETETLPLAIYAALQRPGGEALAWRLAAVSVAISLAALLASELLARRVGRHVL